MKRILTFQLVSSPTSPLIFPDAVISEFSRSGGLIRFPLRKLSAQARANLYAILTEKQPLIQKAIPGFILEEDCISILEKESVLSHERREVYGLFVEKLFMTVNNRKWVVLRRKNTNSAACEKYLFRIWLNQMGMKGTEYASARKLLTENLSGSSAYACPEKMEAYNKRRREARKDVCEAKSQSFIPL